jgi:hypothetical protein
MFENKLVVKQAQIPCPQTFIEIAVDTSYVISQQGQNIGAGVYMIDNQVNNGSTGEGQTELSTVCNVGDLIGFSVNPIDPNTRDTVEITGFNVSSPGNAGVFGSAGYPIKQTPSYWIGQAMNQTHQTYQVQLKVTSGGIRPLSYAVNWDPFITAH